MATILQSDRFSLNSVGILNSALCELSRVPTGVIAPSNYGSFNRFRQLKIPTSNVGTVLGLPRLIRNYLYIEIDIFGGVAGITATGPDGLCGFACGIKNTSACSYTMRFPYCGSIDGFIFYLQDYLIKDIRVYYPSDYLAEETYSPTLLAADDGFGIISQTLAQVISPGTTLKVMLNNSLLGVPGILNNLPSPTRLGRINCSLLGQAGLPTPTVGFTYFDGVNEYSNFLSGPIDIYIPENANPFIQNGYILFTNNSAELVQLSMVCYVRRISDISTAFETRNRRN